MDYNLLLPLTTDRIRLFLALYHVLREIKVFHQDSFHLEALSMGAPWNIRHLKPCHSTSLGHVYTGPQGRKNWTFLTQLNFNQQEETGTTNPNSTFKSFMYTSIRGEMFTDRRTTVRKCVGPLQVRINQGLSSACSFTFQRARQAGADLSAC